jgi:hypothetical protein
VRQAGVELERRIARDVAVLAARVLEHLLHGGEGGHSLGTFLGTGTVAGGQREQKRWDGYQQDACTHGRLLRSEA